MIYENSYPDLYNSVFIKGRNFKVFVLVLFF